MEYIEYPRHLHKAGGEHLVVRNDAEKAAALKAGWSLVPVLEPVEAVPELAEAASVQADESDATAVEAEPKKKGRKSKAD